MKKTKGKPYQHLLITLKPVTIGNWIIKASSLDSDHIMIITYNKNTLESHTKYFTDEEAAKTYVESFTDTV